MILVNHQKPMTNHEQPPGPRPMLPPTTKLPPRIYASQKQDLHISQVQLVDAEGMVRDLLSGKL